MIKRLSKFLILILIILFGVRIGKSTDVRVGCGQASCTLTSQQQWSSLNGVYIIRPLALQNSIYFFIANRNTTSNHTITFSVYQTPSNSVSDYSNNSGFWVNDSINGNCTTINAASMISCWVTTMFASQVAIVISGSTNQSGSPDTADIYINQGIGEPKGQGQGQSFVTDNYQQSQLSSHLTFLASIGSSSPAANTNLFAVTNSNSKSIYFKNLVLTTTSATSVPITIKLASGILSAGCTLAPSNVINTAGSGSGIPISTALYYTCTTPTSAVTIITFNLTIPATGLLIFPMTEFYCFNNSLYTNYIIGYNTSSVTGNISGYLSWSEQ